MTNFAKICQFFRDEREELILVSSAFLGSGLLALNSSFSSLSQPKTFKNPHFSRFLSYPAKPVFLNTGGEGIAFEFQSFCKIFLQKLLGSKTQTDKGSLERSLAPLEPLLSQNWLKSLLLDPFGGPIWPKVLFLEDFLERSPHGYPRPKRRHIRNFLRNSRLLWSRFWPKNGSKTHFWTPLGVQFWPKNPLFGGFLESPLKGPQPKNVDRRGSRLESLWEIWPKSVDLRPKNGQNLNSQIFGSRILE